MSFSKCYCCGSCVLLLIGAQNDFVKAGFFEMEAKKYFH